ncbi:hypothetical protein [Burkholderia cepacia]|uniref:hypothetical protein n=1 Tax=Burkholderia cepacia TaxID=292 RepID=UPI001CF3BD2A|nr:hypothetical protein [Burkholderia cepacia]MCA8355509.1 hypothetical protein [Burkholderia cepacia]
MFKFKKKNRNIEEDIISTPAHTSEELSDRTFESDYEYSELDEATSTKEIYEMRLENAQIKHLELSKIICTISHADCLGIYEKHSLLSKLIDILDNDLESIDSLKKVISDCDVKIKELTDEGENEK